MTNTNSINKNNEIKTNASGGDAQKSMGGRGKKQRKENPAKNELISLRQEVKELRKIRVAKAESEAEAFYWLSLGVNDLLILMYTKQPGASEFKTFNQWKEEGYKVIKGSKSYRVWGKPIKAKHGEEYQAPEVREDDKTGYKYFPMCCLFSNLQVENYGPEGDDNDNTKAVTQQEIKAKENARVIESMTTGEKVETVVRAKTTWVRKVTGNALHTAEYTKSKLLEEYRKGRE